VDVICRLSSRGYPLKGRVLWDASTSMLWPWIWLVPVRNQNLPHLSHFLLMDVLQAQQERLWAVDFTTCWSWASDDYYWCNDVKWIGNRIYEVACLMAVHDLLHDWLKFLDLKCSRVSEGVYIIKLILLLVASWIGSSWASSLSRFHGMLEHSSSSAWLMTQGSVAGLQLVQLRYTLHILLCSSASFL